MHEARIIPERAEVRITEALDAVHLNGRGDNASVFASVVNASTDSARKLVKRVNGGVRIPEPAVPFVDWDTLEPQLIWTPEASRFVANRRSAYLKFPTALETLGTIKASGSAYASRLIADSAGLDTLDDHQIVNVAAMTIKDSPGLCVFDEQGAGKTVTCIFAFDLLVARQQADSMIIVAPKSMVGEWPNDIRRFRGNIYKTAVLSGPSKSKRTKLAAGADIYITNFETAVSMEAELSALMSIRPGRTVLVVDESFFIKSLDAKRTRALRRLREWAGKAYVLCGTPAPNAPADLIQQVSFVDFGLAFSGVDVPEDRAAALPVVQATIERRALFTRHLKVDVLPDLPSKRFQRVIVPMEAKQRSYYETALGQLIEDVQETDEKSFAKSITSFLARRSALLQICSSPQAIVPSYDATPGKLSALDGILEELIERKKEKVVVWSFYTASVNTLVERYRRYHPVRYDGSVSDVDTRREAVARFQNDDETMLFVANPAAAGAGLTLHRSRVAVYESLSNQAAHYLQSLDRIHRRGQTRPVDYLILLCDGSLELDEYDRLTRKEAAAQALLGDTVTPPVTRNSFLGELLGAADLIRAGE